MVLIIGTLVINKQISYAIKSDLGFNKEGIVRVGIPQTLSPKKVESLRNRIAKITGVEKITACYATPAAPDNMWGTSLRYNNNPEDEDFQIQTKMGDENYLSTFDLKLVAGRNFFIKDSVDEILVNEMFVKKVGAQSPEELLGKPISVAGGMIAGKIVGVIEDFHDQDFHSNINAIYIAPDATNYREFSIGINLENTNRIIADIEKEWSEVYPNYIFEYDFLDERIAEMYSSEQEFLSLTKIFSGLAIFIGCLGIYGMILFFVVQKTKEIGIRKVLGGTVPHILLIVTKDFIRLVVIAGVIASPIAWYFMNGWLQNFTFQTEISWWIFPSAIGIVLGITLLTICYQAIKAATANPVESLRTE
jgi:ABC-type antimicrobial peptide transport system permease subunit